MCICECVIAKIINSIKCCTAISILIIAGVLPSPDRQGDQRLSSSLRAGLPDSDLLHFYSRVSNVTFFESK